MHGVVEELKPGSAGILGAIHGGIGVLEDHLSRLATIAGEGDADARTYRDVAFTEREGDTEAREHAARDHGGAVFVFEVFAKNGKFVTPEACDVITLAHELAEAGCRFDQQLVACGVAHRVIDLLESVEIDKEHGQGMLAPPDACQRLLGTFDEQLAVGQAGEWIMKAAIKLEPDKIGDAPAMTRP